MKSTAISAVLVALIGFATVPAFAQDEQPVTRAQVKAEVAALEHVGYNPAYSHGPDYPANLQVAEKKLAAKQLNGSQYGPSTDGTSASGAR